MQDNWPGPASLRSSLRSFVLEPRLIGLIRHYRAPGHGAALVGYQRGTCKVRHGKGCRLRPSSGDHLGGFAGSLILEQTDFVFRHTTTRTNRL